jgi:hypothetical protein
LVVVANVGQFFFLAIGQGGLPEVGVVADFHFPGREGGVSDASYHSFHQHIAVNGHVSIAMGVCMKLAGGEN